jgi:large subunit ribosomal protein L15
MSPINLDRIQSWIDQGRLDPSKPITMKELQKSRCIHGVKRHGVKLLARVSVLPLRHTTMLTGPAEP